MVLVLNKVAKSGGITAASVSETIKHQVKAQVLADEKVLANRGKVALGYGPLVYNVELADQNNIDLALSQAPLKAEWRPDLLGGVMALTGKWADGSTMTAICACKSRSAKGGSMANPCCG